MLPLGGNVDGHGLGDDGEEEPHVLQGVPASLRDALQGVAALVVLNARVQMRRNLC